MLPPPHTVDDDAGLRALAVQLAREPLLAVDTESNSLHAYRERVCLIQISTRTADYIVDPLTIGDLSPLAPLFADPKIEKVFHAAEYDVMCLKRDYGFRFDTLFDTMIAARVCGIKQIGLGNLLADLAGIQMDKSHQRDNWGKRPLPQDSLAYAQMDTHYLPALRDHLTERLTTLNRMEMAQESFEDLCKSRPAQHNFDPEGYWKIAIAHKLSPRETAILRELYLWRERVAEQRGLPPFKVLNDKTLVALAIDQPNNMNDVINTHGVGGSNGRRYGRELMRLIDKGRHSASPPQPPLDPPADPLQVEVYTALRDWRKARANALDVESDVIIARDALWAISEQLPTTTDALKTIPGVGPWRLNEYGDDLLRIVRRFQNR
jgi:ribonuclease D